MKICYIVGAMDFNNELNPDMDDLVIAADAGYDKLFKLGIKPDLIVGDFDSIAADIPKGINVIRHPVMKDDTDMMLAVRLGLERGYKTFHIYGGMGGRTDHTLANIQTLNYIAESGGRGYLFGKDETITVIKNCALHFPVGSSGIISVFAMGGTARGVDEKGLLYPLNDATLTPSYPLGVSNEFTDAEAVVSVKDGSLIVIWKDSP